MLLLAFYWSVIIACYLIASKLREKREKFAFLEKALNIVIYILVFIMGLRMGSNEEVTSNLAVIGLQSVGITVFTVGGSMLLVYFTRKLMGLNRQGVKDALIEQNIEDEARQDESGQDSSGMKTTLIILAFVASGLAIGYLIIPKLFEDNSAFQDFTGDLMVLGITILLAFVGFNMGLDGNVFSNLKEVGIKVIFIPIAAISGSLLMGALYGLISPFTVGEGIAISAGFGWYTMAPGLMVEAGFVVSGAVSFMHNVIRETLGIIIIPLVAKKIGYLEAVCIPGVAAMDVCLPIVEKSCRPETIIYSFCTGGLMCFCTPTIVPLALQFLA